MNALRAQSLVSQIRVHVVCVDKYLKTHSVCFGLLIDLLADTMALFVESFVNIIFEGAFDYP